MKFTYLSQTKFLFRHLEQIRQWLIIIGSSRSHPTTINVSWKSNQEKIIAVAFGVASSAPILERKKELASIRKRNDQHLFPQEQNGDVIQKISRWEFGNCAETNAWTSLCQLRPDIPIKSRMIAIHSGKITLPCENCQACQDWLRRPRKIVGSVNSNQNMNG
ncbi:unnamed protein product [Rhizophagus irregularis]|nr:unnamed protein product [Rhizophagus irregularis]